MTATVQHAAPSAAITMGYMIQEATTCAITNVTTQLAAGVGVIAMCKVLASTYPGKDNDNTADISRLSQ
jgi:hypothetical protein